LIVAPVPNASANFQRARGANGHPPGGGAAQSFEDLEKLEHVIAGSNGHLHHGRVGCPSGWEKIKIKKNKNKNKKNKK
jgi:hypothetical protein